MAPELLDGERVGPATDIYGLACLACETLTGTVPYVRDTDAATMYAHIVEPPAERVASAARSCRARSTPCSPRAWPRIPTTVRRPPGALVIDMLGRARPARSRLPGRGGVRE